MKADGHEIKGAGETDLNPSLKTRSVDQSIKFAQVIARQGKYNHSVLTDHGVHTYVTTRGKQLIINGDPYLTLVNVDTARKTATIIWPENNNSIQKQQSADFFHDINPYMFQSMKFMANYSALFRYIKTSDYPNWQKFMSSLPGLSSTQPRVETPDQQPWD
jgi:hypothetical protein